MLGLIPFFVTIQATMADKKKKKNFKCFATFKKIMRDSVTPFRRLTSASSCVNTSRLLSHSPSQQFQLRGTASAHTCSSATQISERHKRCPNVSPSLEEIFHAKMNGSASPCTQRTAEKITMLELAATWQSQRAMRQIFLHLGFCLTPGVKCEEMKFECGES